MNRLWWIGLLVTLPFTASAQERANPPTVTVDGSASVEREPERAVLTLAVETEAAAARDAAQANADAMTRVNRALRGTGVPASMIRTVSYRLDPVYSRSRPQQEEPPQIVAYRATHMVRVTIDSVPVVGAVIDASIAAGANRVAGLSFELRDPDEARIAALELAMARARRDGEAVAKAAGLGLGPPIQIQIGGAGLVAPFEGFAARAVQEMAATPVEPGTLTVTASVHVVFRLVRQ